MTAPVISSETVDYVADKIRLYELTDQGLVFDVTDWRQLSEPQRNTWRLKARTAITAFIHAPQMRHFVIMDEAEYASLGGK